MSGYAWTRCKLGTGLDSWLGRISANSFYTEFDGPAMNLWIARLNGVADDAALLTNVASEHGDVIRHTQTGPWRYVVFRSAVPTDTIRSRFASLRGIDALMKVETPYVLSSRRAVPERTRVSIGDEVTVGGDEFVVMAGPCSVESREQTTATARGVRASGARVLRGGAFKPRTSPFTFRGLGTRGLEILHDAGRRTGLPIVSEAMDVRDIDEVASFVDIVQIGMRNALNYSLLEEVGRHPEHPPVLLKRGIGSTLDEFLCAADYILAAGNPNVMLCLRGTVGARGQPSRGSLNIADVPALRMRTHLPIIVDPSHVAGDRDLVPAICAAALAAGADGLLIEVHHSPDNALVDGPQSLTLPQFAALMRRLRAISEALGRSMAAPLDGEPHAGHPYEDLALERPRMVESHDSNEADMLGSAQV